MSKVAALCIGWDVGGWHGKKDGLAAIALHADGSVHAVGQTVQLGLGSFICDAKLTVELLTQLTGTTGLTPCRTLIGIDAPLGFPVAFSRHAAAAPLELTAEDMPRGRMIENEHAFRHTDRYVQQVTGKKPLSASFDSLTNNTVKARWGIISLRSNGACRILPFEGDDSDAVALEVYPATWRGRVVGFEHLYEAAGSDDERDAIVAALIAASYEAQRLGLARQLPGVELPPPAADIPVLMHEGWIYLPSLAVGAASNSTSVGSPAVADPLSPAEGRGHSHKNIGGRDFWRVGVLQLGRTATGELVEYSHNLVAGIRQNAHARGPFCNFSLPQAPRAAGVYAIVVADDLKYIGECQDLAGRFSSAGYGRVSPRNCHADGQSTNCKLNSRVLSEAKRGLATEVWFHPTADRKVVEAELLLACSPPWNGHGTGVAAASEEPMEPRRKRNHAAGPPAHGVLSTDSFRIQLETWLAEAQNKDASRLTVRAGDLHRAVGNYPVRIIECPCAVQR